MSRSAWTVPTFKIIALLKENPPGNEKKEMKEPKKQDVHSILDNNFVAYRDRHEMAELHNATQLKPKYLVSFRPERIAWHEAIIAVSTRVRISDEADMHSKTVQLYFRALPLIQAKAKELDKRRIEIQKHVTHIVTQIKRNQSVLEEYQHAQSILKFYKELQSKQIKLGTFVPGYDIEKATIAYFTDKIYNEEANEVMMRLIENEINLAFRKGIFSPISMPSPKDKKLYLVAGGPGSGKSSSVPILMNKAKEEKIDWLDTVKINGDAFKPLLMEPGTTTSLIYSQLAQEEAGIVHDAIYKRLAAMAKKGLRPHVFIDHPTMNKDVLDDTLNSGGKVFVFIVSANAEEAIERSYARGMASGDKGRYEHTELLLILHKHTLLDSRRILEDCVGQSVTVQILDNNASQFAIPEQVMTANFQTKEIVIHDSVKLERYLLKTSINLQATGKNNLYVGKPMTVEEFLQPFISKGMKLMNPPKQDNVLLNCKV